MSNLNHTVTLHVRPPPLAVNRDDTALASQPQAASTTGTVTDASGYCIQVAQAVDHCQPTDMQVSLPMPMPMAATVSSGAGYYTPTSLSGVQWMVPVSFILSPAVAPMISFCQWPASMCDPAAAAAAANGGSPSTASTTSSSDQVSTSGAGDGAGACVQPPVDALPASTSTIRVPGAVTAAATTHPARPLPLGTALVLPQTAAVAAVQESVVAAPRAEPADASHGVSMAPAASASGSCTASSSSNSRGGGAAPLSAAQATVNLTDIPQGLSLSLVTNGLGQAYVLPTGSGGFVALSVGGYGLPGCGMQSGVPVEVEQKDSVLLRGDASAPTPFSLSPVTAVAGAAAEAATGATEGAEGGVAAPTGAAPAAQDGSDDCLDLDNIQLSLCHSQQATSHVPVILETGSERGGRRKVESHGAGRSNSNSNSSGRTVTVPPTLRSVATVTATTTTAAATSTATVMTGSGLSLRPAGTVPSSRPPTLTEALTPAGSGGSRDSLRGDVGGAPVVVKMEMGESHSEMMCEQGEQNAVKASMVTDSRLSFFDASKDKHSWHGFKVGSIHRCSSKGMQAGQVQARGRHWLDGCRLRGSVSGLSVEGDAPAVLAAPAAVPSAPAAASLPHPFSGIELQPTLQPIHSTTHSGLGPFDDDDDACNGDNERSNDGRGQSSDGGLLTWDLNAEYEEQRWKEIGVGDIGRGSEIGSASTGDITKQLSIVAADRRGHGGEVKHIILPSNGAHVPREKARAAGELDVRVARPVQCEATGNSTESDPRNDIEGIGGGGCIGNTGMRYTRLRRNRNYSEPGKYRGVRQRGEGRFSAELKVGRFRRWLGSYKTAEEAARAFDRAAFQLRGSQAKLNFPHIPSQGLTDIRSRCGIEATGGEGMQR